MQKTRLYLAILFVALLVPATANAQSTAKEALNHMIKLKFGAFVEQGHLKSIKKALKTYPQINTMHRMGTELPLLGEGLSRCVNSWRCGTEVISFLMQKGLDINANYYSFYPLEGAILSHLKYFGESGEEMRELQVKLEKSLSALSNMHGGPLSSDKKGRVLSEKESLAKVKLIISLGANVNQLGATKIPLLYYSLDADGGLLALLLSAGADIDLSLAYVDKEIAKNEKIIELLKNYSK